MATKKKAPARASEGAVDALPFLEKLYGPLTLGRALQSIRLCEEQSLETFARALGVSRGHLCDIEKGRRGVSVERAARWARELGQHEGQFVELALQAEVLAAGLSFKVQVHAGAYVSTRTCNRRENIFARDFPRQSRLRSPGGYQVTCMLPRPEKTRKGLAAPPSFL